jgi:hypothetical protein
MIEKSRSSLITRARLINTKNNHLKDRTETATDRLRLIQKDIPREFRKTCSTDMDIDQLPNRGSNKIIPLHLALTNKK